MPVLRTAINLALQGDFKTIRWAIRRRIALRLGRIVSGIAPSGLAVEIAEPPTSEGPQTPLDPAPDRSNKSDAVFGEQETEQSRTDLPGIFIASLPKSGTVFLETTLTQGLGKPRLGIPSGGLFPDATIPHEAINLLRQRGAVYVIHCAPSTYNRIELSSRLERMVVHVRDPRQELISWCHFFPVVMRELDPAQAIHLGVPEDYLNWSFKEQVDWQIDNYFPLQVEWITGLARGKQRSAIQN